MRVLITGLNGLIGWNLFKQFRLIHDTHGTFRKEHACFESAPCYKIDFSRPSEIKDFLGALKPDYLIHSWAMCDLDLCELFPQMAYSVNVIGTRNLLTAAAELAGLKKIVFVSTDHVFDGDRGNYSESDTPMPKHVYGRTKKVAEDMIGQSTFPFLIVRPGLVIGDSVQGNKGPRDFLFHRIRCGKPTHYFTDELRSPIDAENFAGKVADALIQDRSGILHLAGEKILSRYELARRLAIEQGLPTQLIYPRLRSEDRWAAIRPRDLSLRSEIL